ncbi:MAG: isocitrate lyase/phosphoenolpyruvate mutase family protein [Actinomycetota bacterium]|nr:isocitrate lyase/phosphoenolpyruvate mutase family protein [Actinomycetota bacterium]
MQSWLDAAAGLGIAGRARSVRAARLNDLARSAGAKGRRFSCLAETLDHVRALDGATRLPISVDLEHGYGPEPGDGALAIIRAAEAGAVGGSIEDYDPDKGIYELGRAAERVAAASEAAASLGFPFTLTARAENHIRGNPDLEDTVARLQAYERAGADVRYAPGLPTSEEIKAVCDGVSKPVNVLANPALSMHEIVEAGAHRVSVGGALAWTAIGAMAAAVDEMSRLGVFASLGSGAQVREWVG